MEEKICNRCGITKTTKDFHFKKDRKGLNCLCKSCVYEIQKKRWKDRKLKAIELMGGCCCKCGYDKNYAALQFHHIDPKEKEFDWLKLRLRKWSSVINELQKCILVCSNCHMEIHNPNLEKSTNKNELLTDNSRLNNVKIVESTGNCPACQKEVYGTKFCSVNCSSIYNRKVVRPSKEELASLIENNSWLAISRKYEVSDNAVRRWARNYGLIEK